MMCFEIKAFCKVNEKIYTIMKENEYLLKIMGRKQFAEENYFDVRRYWDSIHSR